MTTTQSIEVILCNEYASRRRGRLHLAALFAASGVIVAALLSAL